VVSDYTPHYRAIAEGFQHVCPADTGYVEVPVAVSTEVSLDVVEIKDNGEGGFPIFGMCQQSEDYVMVTGTEGNTGTYKDSLFNTFSGNKVRVRAFPQNPGAESWVMYYLNGNTYAAGPVGSARPNPRLPEPGSVSYQILENGEYCDMPLKEGDKVYVMYGTDTISADGRYTHYSSRYEMWRVEPNGALQLESEDYMVCPGGEVNLQAYFDEPEDSYGHIDQSQTLVWEPAEALDGTPTGWTAKGKPTEETVYKVSAEDGMHCPWTDSLRIYLVQEGEGLSLPFRLASPDSVFCGTAIRTGVRAYIPDNNKDLSNTFSKITYYLCDASATVKETLEPNGSIDTVEFSMAVQEGWSVYAVAKAKADCNTALSYSDTLVFRAVARPVIERISPVLSDTTVCLSQPLELNYAQPEGCGFAWHSELVPKWGGDGDLNRAYIIDRNTQVVFEAYRTDLPSCRSFDTVQVNMVSGGASGLPSLSLSASASAACGEEEVVYTLQERNCDTIVWYVNGEEAARDVLSFAFVPLYSGPAGVPDTVCVYGSRAASLCAPFASVWSDTLITYRVEKPVITFVSSDTTVMQDSTLELHVEATVPDGDPASFLWIEGEDKEVSRSDTYSFTVSSAAVYTVRAYQEAVLEIADKCFADTTVKVTMKTSGGGEVYPLPPLAGLSLSASATWLCGEDTVLYTLASVAGYDTLVWFENGLEIARDVWQLRRTPAYTGFDRADTVFVRGIAVDPVSEGVDTVRYRTSERITVHRIEKPVFVYVSPRDTLVEFKSEVLLSALASSPDSREIVYTWIDSLGDEELDGATVRIYPEKSQHYYVYAEQYRSDNFECYAEDSAMVRVSVKMGELEIYIPNTVIPYSQKPENTHLRVYGLNVKNVHLQIFNERSEKLYEGEGDA
ncbi:MAG: hypothetical protein K2I83_01145, partial [Bacteroidales bacterium]|nr:hypothetical protein [Bacteroidales bacterium]